MSIDEVMKFVERVSHYDPARPQDLSRLRAAIEQHVTEVVAGERVTVLDEVLRGLRSERDTDQLRAIFAEVEAIRARAEKETT